MKDIELVVKIPKKVYKAICDKNALGCDVSDIKNIIRNGTTLPRGHGKLIDISQIDKDKIESSNPVISLMVDDEYIEAVSLDYLSGLQTIIQADEYKAESEAQEGEK